ncbi:hypothetical protein D3C75_678000 [compost metagenome]
MSSQFSLIRMPPTGTRSAVRQIAKLNCSRGTCPACDNAAMKSCLIRSSSGLLFSYLEVNSCPSKAAKKSQSSSSKSLSHTRSPLIFMAVSLLVLNGQLPGQNGGARNRDLLPLCVYSYLYAAIASDLLSLLNEQFQMLLIRPDIFGIICTHYAGGGSCYRIFNGA